MSSQDKVSGYSVHVIMQTTESAECVGYEAAISLVVYKHGWDEYMEGVIVHGITMPSSSVDLHNKCNYDLFWYMAAYQ